MPCRQGEGTSTVMNIERAMLRAKLSELKAKRIEIINNISAKLNAVKNILAPLIFTSVREINIKDAHIHIKEADSLKTELIDVDNAIINIEKDLE